MHKFFGGPLFPTLVKLVLASVGVGIVLAIFSIEPLDLWENFLHTVARIWAMGFDLVDWSVKYFLIGAVIVIPLWLIIRFWSVIVERDKN